MNPAKSGRRGALGSIGSLGSLGAALLALTSSVWAGVQPEPVAADAAPQAWVAYAQRVSEHLQSALSGDAQTAQRFGAFFDEWVATDAHTVSGAFASGVAPDGSPFSDDGPPVAGGPLPTLKVRVWLDRAGHVTRVEFDEAAIGDDHAAEDLRALLLQQSVGVPPPRAMKQPVVIRLVPGAQL